MRKLFGYLEEAWRKVMPQKDGVTSAAEPTLAEAFQAPVSALQVRASLLLRLALIFGGVAVTAGLVGLVCYTVGWLHLPTGQVDKILLPQHAIDVFNPVESSSSGSSGLGLTGSLTSVNETVSSLLTGTLFSALSGIVFVVALANAVFRLSVAPLLMMIPIIALPTMVKVVTGVDPSDGDAEPGKNALVVAAKDNDYVTIKQLLNKESTIDDFTKAYILAQAAIAAHVNEPKVLQAATKDLRSDAWASLTRKLSNGMPSKRQRTGWSLTWRPAATRTKP